MRISLIVAMSENGIIGHDGGLPWRISSDLQRFKRLTMGHHLIMGRKTHESIGRLLPGRESIIVSRSETLEIPGAQVAHSVDQAIELAEGDDEVFVIGGAEIYRSMLPHVDRIYLTAIRADVEGDTSFPDWEPERWRVVEESDHEADARNELPHSYRVLDRAQPHVAATQ